MADKVAFFFTRFYIATWVYAGLSYELFGWEFTFISLLAEVFSIFFLQKKNQKK